MLLLLETPGGYVIFQKKKSLEGCKNFEIYSFYEYNSKNEACKSIESLKFSKIPKSLNRFLKNCSQKNQSLVVNDVGLKKNLIKKIEPFFKKILAKKKIFRELKKNIDKTSVKKFYEKKKILTVTHSIFNRKLKFTSFKIDKIVIYTIRIIDELEKEVNVYTQRLKEWYSWHFPELFSIILDNLTIAKVISRIETREQLVLTDLSDLLPNSTINKITEASEISLGVRIHEDDLACILSLCSQIISFNNFKDQLLDYLKSRMYKIAPNLTAITGEKVGARLIHHAGALLNLAKSHASRVQIFGAEKALFRAIKSKTNTPKYGLIFNINYISKADKKIKGKISRMLSAKIVLSARIDALGETTYGGSIGLKNRINIENKIKQLNSFLEKFQNI